MTTQIKSISVSLDGTTQSTDEGVTLQHGDLSTVRCNLMTRRQTGWTTSENNDVFVISVQLKYAGVGMK